MDQQIITQIRTRQRLMWLFTLLQITGCTLQTVSLMYFRTFPQRDPEYHLRLGFSVAGAVLVALGLLLVIFILARLGPKRRDETYRAAWQAWHGSEDQKKRNYQAMTVMVVALGLGLCIICGAAAFEMYTPISWVATVVFFSELFLVVLVSGWPLLGPLPAPHTA